MVKQFIKIYKNKYIYLFFIIILLFLMSFDGLSSPYFLGKLTDLLNSKNFSSVNKLIFYWMLFLIYLAIIHGLLTYLGSKVKRDIKIKLKENEILKSINNKNSKNSEYMSIITTEISQVDENFLSLVPNFIYCIFQSIVTFVFLMRINVTVGLVFVLLGIIPIVVPKFTEKLIQNNVGKWTKLNTEFINKLNDFLITRKMIERYQVVKEVLKKLHSKLIETEDSYFKIVKLKIITKSFTDLGSLISLCLSIFIGVKFVSNGKITTGELISIYMASNRVVSPIISAVFMYTNIKSVEPIVEKLLKNNDYEEKELFLKEMDEDRILEINNLIVGYENKKLIDNIDLVINKNEKILIKAPSGSGKTTLLKTIMNELQPLDGKIYFSKDIFENGLNNIFGYVEQAPFLFDDTLLFNITLGKNYEEEEIINILNRVGLKKLANKESLNKEMSKEKEQLSGGELKRIEFARVLLLKRPILIIDEVLSGLALENSKIINEILLDYNGVVIDVEHHITKEIEEKYDKVIEI